jgi:hypothetical protein
MLFVGSAFTLLMQLSYSLGQAVQLAEAGKLMAGMNGAHRWMVTAVTRYTLISLLSMGATTAIALIVS